MTTILKELALNPDYNGLFTLADNFNKIATQYPDFFANDNMHEILKDSPLNAPVTVIQNEDDKFKRWWIKKQCALGHQFTYIKEKTIITPLTIYDHVRNYMNNNLYKHNFVNFLPKFHYEKQFLGAYIRESNIIRGVIYFNLVFKGCENNTTINELQVYKDFFPAKTTVNPEKTITNSTPITLKELSLDPSYNELFTLIENLNKISAQYPDFVANDNMHEILKDNSLNAPVKPNNTWWWTWISKKGALGHIKQNNIITPLIIYDHIRDFTYKNFYKFGSTVNHKYEKIFLGAYICESRLKRGVVVLILVFDSCLEEYKNKLQVYKDLFPAKTTVNPEKNIIANTDFTPTVPSNGLDLIVENLNKIATQYPTFFADDDNVRNIFKDDPLNIPISLNDKKVHLQGCYLPYNMSYILYMLNNNNLTALMIRKHISTHTGMFLTKKFLGAYIETTNYQKQQLKTIFLVFEGCHEDHKNKLLAYKQKVYQSKTMFVGPEKDIKNEKLLYPFKVNQNDTITYTKISKMFAEYNKYEEVTLTTPNLNKTNIWNFYRPNDTGMINCIIYVTWSNNNYEVSYHYYLSTDANNLEKLCLQLNNSNNNNKIKYDFVSLHNNEHPIFDHNELMSDFFNFSLDVILNPYSGAVTYTNSDFTIDTTPSSFIDF